ncbi:MAG: aminotransferase class V-fold PLP-dependent enzyme [Halobacteriovoraceae bacterium]|nr:aminotransferase class V-fold PLP-dependent enzyme [Halobacteriovoraceae bacterium]
MKTYYLDYNATAPLVSSVKELLKKDEFPFANASSLHRDGKSSRRSMLLSQEAIKKCFKQNEHFHLFFHSGATEGINTICKGLALKYFNEISFVYFSSDHSAVRSQKTFFEKLGCKVLELCPLPNGDFDIQHTVDSIKNLKTTYTLLNYTWVNNESGVVWTLDDAQKIVDETNCFVHVDGAQAIGKIEDWNKLNSKLHYYTFSGHKIGALKGVGLSFVNTLAPFESLINGGTHQEGRRGGTENTLGIKSLQLALEEICKIYSFNKQFDLKQKFLNKLNSRFKDEINILGNQSKYQNSNTVFFEFLKERSDVVLTALDLEGIEVGTGSACSSGSIKPSSVALAYGLSEEDAKKVIRISFSPIIDENEIEIIFEKIENVLSRF